MFYRDLNQKYLRIRLNRKQLMKVDFQEILHRDIEMTEDEEYSVKNEDGEEESPTFIPN